MADYFGRTAGMGVTKSPGYVSPAPSALPERAVIPQRPGPAAPARGGTVGGYTSPALQAPARQGQVSAARAAWQSLLGNRGGRVRTMAAGGERPGAVSYSQPPPAAPVPLPTGYAASPGLLEPPPPAGAWGPQAQQPVVPVTPPIERPRPVMPPQLPADPWMRAPNPAAVTPPGWTAPDPNAVTPRPGIGLGPLTGPTYTGGSLPNVGATNPSASQVELRPGGSLGPLTAMPDGTVSHQSSAKTSEGPPRGAIDPVLAQRADRESQQAALNRQQATSNAAASPKASEGPPRGATIPPTTEGRQPQQPPTPVPPSEKTSEGPPRGATLPTMPTSGPGSLADQGRLANESENRYLPLQQASGLLPSGNTYTNPALMAQLQPGYTSPATMSPAPVAAPPVAPPAPAPAAPAAWTQQQQQAINDVNPAFLRQMLANGVSQAKLNQMYGLPPGYTVPVA